MVNEVDDKFSLYEFDIMTNLWFNQLIDIGMYIPLDDTCRIRYTYFDGKKSTGYENVSKVFKQRPWGEYDEDTVKLVLPYYLYHGLLRSDSRKKNPAIGITIGWSYGQF